MLLDICMWLISPVVLFHWTAIINGYIFHVISLYRFISYYGNIFYGWCWCSNINVTVMILFFSYVCIKWRSVLWSSILLILLTVIILWRLMKWYLLFSTIIIGVTSWFLWTPIVFWIIFRRVARLTLYENTIKFNNNNIVIKMRNAWKTFDLTYYWPACGKIISLPIAEKHYSLKALFQNF